MKITESQLRRLIRESIEYDEDDDDLFDFGEIPDWMSEIPQALMTTVSSEPIAGISDASEKNMSDLKPRGLWYAPGKDWIDWMSTEMPKWLDEVNYVYALKPAYASGGLESQGGVLQIRTERELRAFNNKFRFESEGSSVSEIRWDDVADRWDGVEIVPHHRGARRDMNMMWYSSWDIASGCIWRPRGATALKLITSKPGVR